MKIPSAQPPRDVFDRLLDGEAIDWNRQDAAEPDLLDALHTLDQVRGTYQRIAMASAPNAPQLFQWGPLSVQSRIGSGATADVWRAWDPGLSTPVALKLLRPEAAAAGLRSDEFLREGRLLARLSQRNVLRVYGAAVHDGRPGIWNEWIEGRTLEAIVAEDGPFAGAEATHIGLELCAALAAIHAAGLVHGDVKASNVLRARGGRIVLADLGAGGAPDTLNKSLRTQATPAYLSPQSQGGAPRSMADDLYALGVLLHFLLTGAYPEGGASRIRAIVPDVDRRVADAIESALANEPSRRHGDVHAFADAIRAATRASAPTAARRMRGRGFAAAVLVGLAAIACVGTWQATRQARWAPQATLFRHDRADAVLHDGDALQIGDRLDLKIASTRPTWVYVLNEDDAGVFHVLFPLSGLARTNPLPRGDVVLPGERGGHALSWQVSSRGGHEEFLVVLADAPLHRLERRITQFAAATVDAPERGVGRVSDGPLANVTLHGPHLNALLGELADELGDQRHTRLRSYRFSAASGP